MKPEPRRYVIETYLRPAERDSVAEWCRGAHVSPDVWPLRMECRGWLELAIWRRMAEEQQSGRAGSDKRARELACGAFGLSAEMVRQRFARATRRRLSRK